MKRRVRDLTIAALVVLFLSSNAIYSQILNPFYLAEMPAPARVIAEIKGKDAEDTGQRQSGAFMALIQLMDDMAWGIEHRYVNNADLRKITPDESRMRQVYQAAYADLQRQVTNKEAHLYDHDRNLLQEILGKLFSENFRAIYFQSDANAAARFKAFQDRMYSNSTTAASTPQATPATPANQSAAPGSQAELRRCIASGRSMRSCYTESLGNGFDQMLGLGINLKQPVPPGLRMTGDYSNPGGFRLIFEPEQVTLVCRGVPVSQPYTVQITETQALVTVQHESKGVAFALTSDGKLTGSGPIRVTGQVPSGSHAEQTMGTTTQKTTTTRELTPLEAQSYPNARENATRNGQVYTVQEDADQLVYGPSGTRMVTDFVTRTADCALGALSAIGSSPPMHIPTNDFDILTTIGSGMGALMKGGNANDAAKEMLFPESEKNIVPGLRMSGSYASETGFSLNFHPESVTVGCGDAERALEYSVQRAGSKTMLVIKDNPSPISLQLMPDGSIVGPSQPVQVNGRIITGTTEDINNPFVFAPHVASCPVGRLVAGAPLTKPAAVAPVAVPPAAAGAAPRTASAAAGTSLKITAGAGVVSLLAGKSLVVLKDSLENVLASGGLSAQTASSRISAWAHACERSAREAICQQGIASFGSYLVATTVIDGTGTATFNNVPSSGTFYVVADTSYTHHMIWNLRVDLKPGANSITLDERNATSIDR